MRRADYGGWFEFDDARSEADLCQAQLSVARSESDLFEEEWFARRGAAWFVDVDDMLAWGVLWETDSEE